MNKYIIAALVWGICLAAAAQFALPITEYDYQMPEQNVSPVVMGMGGMNVTSHVDAFAGYHNPALLASVEYTSVSTSYRLANDENLSFWQAMQVSNALKEKQFKYFGLSAKQFAVAYQPVANVHLVQGHTMNNLNYYDYKLDKLQLSMAAADNRYPALKAGLSVKYLTGRLVYLKLGQASGDVFIDDKVKGFSTDLGMTYDQGSLTWGVVAYDLFSRLYWENYPSVPIQRRMAVGMDWHSGGTKLLAGVQYKVAKDPDTSFHFGLEHNWGWESGGVWDEGNVSQNLGLRLGMFSSDFYGTKNISYTLGTGYNYNIFRFDMSLTNRGMVLKDSNYLFSVGIDLK